MIEEDRRDGVGGGGVGVVVGRGGGGVVSGELVRSRFMGVK